MGARGTVVGAIPTASEGIEMGDEESGTVVYPHFAICQLVGYDCKAIVLRFIWSYGGGCPYHSTIAMNYAPYNIDAACHCACH